MTVRRFQQVAGTAVGVAALGLGVTPPAHAAGVRVVLPGESIQRAVDAAAPGDTVLVLPGTYRESVRITVPGLTLRGTGALTVITPATPPPAATTPTTAPPTTAPPTTTSPDTTAPAATTPAADTPTAAATPTDAASDACAQAGNGICVTGTPDHRLTGVTVESLTVTGFAKYGVSGTETDGLTVRDVRADANGLYGIGAEKSVRTGFTGNRADRNGEAGIFLANTTEGEAGAIDTEGALISHNAVSGNQIGVVVRRARNLTVADNTMSGNCGGLFLVGDENVPRAGAMTVSGNTVTGNNAYCAATSRLPYVQGSGIVLTGVEDTVVTGNIVTDNVGASPLSGGVVFFPSFVGSPSSGNSVENNTVLRNGPADLADHDTGSGNTFTGNDCAVSLPAGRC